MAYLTNFSFEVFYKIFTEDASLPLLYHGAKKSKMTKNSNQGGPACEVDNLHSYQPVGQIRDIFLEEACMQSNGKNGEMRHLKEK